MAERLVLVPVDEVSASCFAELFIRPDCSTTRICFSSLLLLSKSPTAFHVLVEHINEMTIDDLRSLVVELYSAKCPSLKQTINSPCFCSLAVEDLTKSGH